MQLKAWEKQQDAIKAAKKAGLSKKKAEDKAKDDKAKKGVLWLRSGLLLMSYLSLVIDEVSPKLTEK